MEPIKIDIDYIKNMNKRHCFDEAKDFLDRNKGKSGRILALYGLRRTGKTILMSQLAIEYGVDYIYQVKPDNIMDDVYAKLKEEKAKGTTLVFLDEITNADDFVEEAALIPDKFAKEGMNIVIAGTDSLGLDLAGRGSLLDRLHTISMTYVPFAEHSDVLDSNDIDEYIKYGGLMHQGINDREAITDYESAKRYLNSAVAGNIANSLNKAPIIPDYRELAKYSINDLEKIIQKTVEVYSGVFEAELFNKKTKNTIISVALNNLEKSDMFQNNNIPLDGYSRKDINNKLKEELNLIDGLERKATDLLVIQLEYTLRNLGLLSAMTTDKFEYRSDENPYNHTNIYHNNDKEYYIIQPAIKYNQLIKAIEVLKEDDFFKMIPVKDRELAYSKLEEFVLGIMTEAIVQFDTDNSLEKKTHYVCKPKYEDLKSNDYKHGEFDMLVYSSKTNTYFGFEIKHTSNPYQRYDAQGNYLDGQDKHLVNPKLTDAFNTQFGECEGVCVLYNGSPFIAPNDTIYLNTSDFLISTYTHKDIHKAMEKLIADIPRKSIKEFTEPSKPDTTYPVDMTLLDEKYHVVLNKLILCKHEALRENFLADMVYMMADGKKNNLLKPSSKIIKNIVNDYKKLPDFERRCKEFMKSTEGKEFISALRKTNCR